MGEITESLDGGKKFKFICFATGATAHYKTDVVEALGIYTCEKSDPCESPIEVLWKCLTEKLAAGGLALIKPQYKVEPYRVDFAVPNKKLAVELDGHGFHSSKEQRTRDAQRDRHLMTEGWQVIRFTGSEMYKDYCQMCRALC